MSGQVRSLLIVVVVAGAVGGVAWFRSTSREPVGAPSGAVPAAQPIGASSAPSSTTAPAEKGELCPESLPTTSIAASQPATIAATPSSAPAGAKKLPRVVDLGADKCKACKELAPILEQLRKEYAGRVTVDFIDVWKKPEAGEPYKIRVIPTQVFFDAEGKEVWRHEGFLPKADFIAKFAELGVK